jgi:multiple sugar transport system permease protein
MTASPNVTPSRAAGRTSGRTRSRASRSMSRTGYVWIAYIAPAVLILLSTTVVPFAYLIYNSLTHWDLRRAYLGKSWAGLGNYADMLHDPLFWSSLETTFLAAAGVVVVELTLGMLLALLFNREFAGKRVFRSLFLLPLIMTPVVVGLTWRMLYNSDLGMINYLLRSAHLPTPNWLASAQFALPSIVITDAWHETPFVTLMFVAGLQSLPTEPNEAARLDGASPLQLFWHITLPQLRPLIFLALIFRATDAIRLFDTIFVMTNGGPANATQTLNMYAYKVGFSFLNMGYGSALAVVLLAICLAISIVLVKYSRLDLEGGRG